MQRSYGMASWAQVSRSPQYDLQVGQFLVGLSQLGAVVAQLNLHVGHKVEVTGTVADSATAPAGAGSSTNVPRLKVDSVKMLDATCPR